jgi:hypothetical protein
VSDAEIFHDNGLVMPALLREARGAYTAAIRRAFADEGFDDMPPAGAAVLGRVGAGASVRTASPRIVEALIALGYLERPAAGDAPELTERGRLAAGAMRGAIERTDAALLGAIGATRLTHMRAGLAVLVDIAYGEEIPTTPPPIA